MVDFWLTGRLSSRLIAPWFFAAVETHDLAGVLATTPERTVFYCGLFGSMWRFSGLIHRQTMRYLGLSLGMAVALRLCTVFGTLILPTGAGEFATKLLDTGRRGSISWVSRSPCWRSWWSR